MKKTHATFPPKWFREDSPKARSVLAHSFGCVLFFLYHPMRKVNYLTQNDGKHQQFVARCKKMQMRVYIPGSWPALERGREVARSRQPV
jgi:hypothetical protein